jgi:hypothetical protein
MPTFKHVVEWPGGLLVQVLRLHFRRNNRSRNSGSLGRVGDRLEGLNERDFRDASIIGAKKATSDRGPHTKTSTCFKAAIFIA